MILTTEILLKLKEELAKCSKAQLALLRYTQNQTSQKEGERFEFIADCERLKNNAVAYQKTIAKKAIYGDESLLVKQLGLQMGKWYVLCGKIEEEKCSYMMKCYIKECEDIIEEIKKLLNSK